MRGGSKKSSAVRSATDRRHWRPKGERRAIRDRPSTQLGTAVKPATLHGQSVAGYRRDRRGFQRARHSYLVTSASRNPRLSRLRLSSSPRRSPAPLRPHGLRDRRAERHNGEKPWTSAFPLSTHCAFVPKARRMMDDPCRLRPIPAEAECETGLIASYRDDRSSLANVDHESCDQRGHFPTGSNRTGTSASRFVESTGFLQS